jgi:hypothetical protein
MQFPMCSQMPMIPQDSHVSSDANGAFLSRHPDSDSAVNPSPNL